MMTNSTRRTFLRGAGVALALPLLHAATPTRAWAATENEKVSGAGALPPKRLVAINIPLGFYSPLFFPTTAGRDYQLSPYLEPAANLRNDFTVISGTSHPNVDGGHAAEKTFLTAAPHPDSRSFKNSISLDQVVARHIGPATRFASLTLGDHGLSWSANGVAIPHENSSSALFAKLFLTGKPAEVAAEKQQLHDGKSILDVVMHDAKAMAERAGQLDRDKLDQYFTAVRETEHNIHKAEKWSETDKPKVDAKQPERISSSDTIAQLRAHFSVIRLALITDSSRVITYGGSGGGHVIPLKGVTMGYHGLSHHGKNPEMLEQLEIIDRAIIKEWIDFIASLKATQEGDSNLLARTQVLLGSNLGNASGHLTTNLPIILAGGNFKHGQHLAFDQKNNYPLPNLFVSMLQGLGLEEDKFASSTGTMTGLELG